MSSVFSMSPSRSKTTARMVGEIVMEEGTVRKRICGLRGIIDHRKMRDRNGGDRVVRSRPLPPVSGKCQVTRRPSLTHFCRNPRLAALRSGSFRIWHCRRQLGLSRGLPNDGDGRRNSRAAQVAQAYRLAHEVVSAALALGLLVWGGVWLDEKSGWSPALTICGACLGFVVAGASLRQLLRRLDQEAARKKRGPSDSRETHSR
jgi:F0F1-type ATP synthase assembly protein I